MCNEWTGCREQDLEYSHLAERLETVFLSVLICAEGCPHWEGMGVGEHNWEACAQKPGTRRDHSRSSSSSSSGKELFRGWACLSSPGLAFLWVVAGTPMELEHRPPHQNPCVFCRTSTLNPCASYRGAASSGHAPQRSGVLLHDSLIFEAT